MIKIPKHDYTQPEYKKCAYCSKYIPLDKDRYEDSLYCSKSCMRKAKTNRSFRQELSTMTMGPVKK